MEERTYQAWLREDAVAWLREQKAARQRTVAEIG